MPTRTKRLDHIDIVELQPTTASGDWPAKATVGRPIEVSAVLLKDGHDVLAAALRWRRDGGTWAWAPMQEGELSRFTGRWVPLEAGPHQVQVVAWTDRFAGWRRDLVKRAAAGQDLDVEFEVGARLLEHLCDQLADDAARARVGDAVAGLRSASCSAQVRLDVALDPELAVLVDGVVAGWDQTRSPKLAVWVDREAAEFSAWYELFPRSYGGFRGVITELDRIAGMGFDTLYLPPIHPIGRTFRKGPGNSLEAGPDDPGSPWAIGGAEGGHTAIHPGLGTEEDLAELVAEARARGIEVALDFALQCSPDHPWVASHPEWFNRLPDGSIRYAENPPKKYQDIYPINFWPDREADRVALWQACRGVLEHWIKRGIRCFRVDNPHTKPLAFWAWVIAEIQRNHPDVLFLAEAFTAPGMMSRLGEIGFSQSYTYFTWRTHRAELTEYVQELTSAPSLHQMRPNFWPNTPDILEGVLRNGPLSAFALRVVLAATLVPSYGIYSGYELGENAPQRDDNTEYLNSEKYQVVRRDFAAEPNLNGLLRTLNAFRRAHRSLQRLEGIHFHGCDNEALLVYSRRWDDDVVLVVVNLDPFAAQAGTLSLDLAALGIGWDEPFAVDDALGGERFSWRGPNPWVRLDPASQPAHLLHVRPG
ncbi:MAG: maltotransferase domain-containing protein [Acidimicrobiia bacterium]